MMKNIILRGPFLLIIFLLVGCNGPNHSTSDYMAFEDIRYVNTFPQTFSLNNAIEINTEDLDVLGISDFRVCDSLLIFSTQNGRKGFWSIVSLPDYRSLGDFIRQGQGPYEFSFCPWASQNNFFKEKGEIFAAIYDYNKGNLYKMNIDESIKNNHLSISTLKDSLPPFMFYLSMIDSDRFFCKKINGTHTQQLRYILDNGKEIIPPHFEKLNSASIREGEDFNILSTGTKYNLNKKLIVEAPTGLNYLNLYSIDGSLSKTICVGSRLDNITKIQNTKREDRIYTFANLRLFSKFWGVIYINEDQKTYSIKGTQLPSILLFDWNGEPLAKLELDRFAISFDIDFINGFLYTLDRSTEQFCKYDIRDVLDKINL
ncbi:MAG: BF3164 family lipoprotein [Bacteroidales bacterium]|nr:BF3164 family lipoprotein [Bacteroidales bacterium]